MTHLQETSIIICVNKLHIFTMCWRIVFNINYSPNKTTNNDIIKYMTLNTMKTDSSLRILEMSSAARRSVAAASGPLSSSLSSSTSAHNSEAAARLSSTSPAVEVILVPSVLS